MNSFRDKNAAQYTAHCIQAHGAMSNLPAGKCAPLYKFDCKTFSSFAAAAFFAGKRNFHILRGQAKGRLNFTLARALKNSIRAAVDGDRA